MDGWDVVRFLCHLLRHIPGKLLILWDGASIHRGEAVRKLLDTDHHQDIWLERFPPYAPDLNPDEGIWHYFKNVELRNRCIDTPPQFTGANYWGDLFYPLQSFQRNIPSKMLIWNASIG